MDGASPMADYEPGKMDIETQKETYDLFWLWTVRTTTFVSVVLFLMYLFLT